MSDTRLEVIPLGGLGEFGMNMMALRCRGDIIVIDAGVLFPGHELLGVDVIVPELEWLVDHRDELRGLVCTHGHEDHIGAVPYVLSELNPPVYATAFTEALIRRKLDEHRLSEKPDLRRMRPGQPFELGCFKVHPIHVTHSTVDCVALAVETPLGTVIHTADFKIDQSPVDGKLFDLHAFAEFGKKGVLLLLSDSTNVDRPGFTPSERAVWPAFEDLFASSESSIFVSCFSSATHRVQQIIDLSVNFGRKVALVGRSLTTASELAHDLGLLRIPDGTLVRPQDLYKVPRERRTVIVSGTQGEPLSSMARAAVGQHKYAVIEEGDQVVMSARMIPGNETAIFRMIDHLCRRGAEVHYGAHSPPWHVSGHAYQEELKLILNLTRPKYFVPVHGEYRQLSGHARLAAPLRDSGLEETFVLQSGETLVIDEYGARRGDDVPVGRVFIDLGTGDEIVEEMVIRDRRRISEFGVIVPIVSIDSRTGKVVGGPEIIARGYAGADEEELLEEARELVEQTVETSTREETADLGVMEEKIRAEIRRYLTRKTSRSNRPLIIPVVLET
ncbi:MAG: ribonuclease J [Bryobacterales bacterium]